MCVKKPTNKSGRLAKPLLGKQPWYICTALRQLRKGTKIQAKLLSDWSLEQLSAGQDVTAVITCPVHNYLWYLAESKHNFRGVSSATGERPDHRGTCPFLAVQHLQDKTSMINTGNWWGAPHVQTNLSTKISQCPGCQPADLQASTDLLVRYS